MADDQQLTRQRIGARAAAAGIFAYREDPILMVTGTGAATTKSRATALNTVSKSDHGGLTSYVPYGGTPTTQKRPLRCKECEGKGE